MGDVLAEQFDLAVQRDLLRAQGEQLVAAGVALALVPFTPPGIPIIAACAGALVALWRRAEA